MAENGKNLRLGLVIEAIDKATSVIERVNARVEHMVAPITRVQTATRRWYEASRLGELRERFDAVGEGIERVQQRAQNMLNLEAYVGVAGGAIFELTKRVAENAETVENLSKRLGIATRDVQRYGYAFKQSGADVDSFAESLKFLARNAVDAQLGNKELVSYFHAIGISSRDLKKDSPIELLDKIADWAQKFPAKAKEGAVFMTLLGRGGDVMAPALQKGSNALHELGDEAERFGLASNKTLEESNKFNAALTRMDKAVGSLFDRLGDALLPGMTKLFDRITMISLSKPQFFTDLTDRLGEIVEQLPEILTSFLKLFGILTGLIGAATKLADAFGGWGTVIAFIAEVQFVKLLASIGQLGVALGALGLEAALNPLLLTLWAISAAILVIIANWDKLTKLSESLSKPTNLQGSPTATRGVRFNANGLPVADAPTSADTQSAEDLLDRINTLTAGGNRVAPPLPDLSTRGPAASLMLAPPAQSLHASVDHARKVDVGGELRISFDQNGRPRVQQMRTRGPMNFTVASGPMAAGTP